MYGDPEYPVNEVDQTLRRRFKNWCRRPSIDGPLYAFSAVCLAGAAIMLADQRYKTPDNIKNLNTDALNNFVDEWNELGTTPIED